LGIQAKLKIGEPNDKYEQEADRVADQVMRMPEPQVQRVCPKCEEDLQRQPIEPEKEEEETLQTKAIANRLSSLIQRQAEPAEEEEDEEVMQPKRLSSSVASTLQRQVEPEEGAEEETLQAKTNANQHNVMSTPLQNRITALRGNGQPLAQSERAFFEPRFGTDFSQVRIHTGSQAAETARAVNARAFTLGRDIVFGAGQYQAHSTAGKNLLAHELTHVVQQQGTHLNTLQRKHNCENDPSTAPSGMGCAVASPSPAGIGIDATFNIEESTLSASDIAALHHLVQNWHSAGGTDRVRVDGFASCDGSASFNWRLSCERALAVAHELLHPSDPTLTGIPAAFVELFANGETDRFSTRLAPNRRVTITLSATTPTPTPTSPSEPSPSECQPRYDTHFAPSTGNCAIYSSRLAKNWLTFTYRHNAQCACENTPNNPKNNCVRKCLQEKMRQFLLGLNRSGAVIGSCIDPLGLLDFVCPEPWCSDLHDHHLECYRECCCNDEFINYPTFLTMCEAPFPCSFVSQSIDWFNECQ
jgi:flagellar motor protein MotB